MDRISVSTTQNVYIDYQAAGIGDRTIAYIIDFSILFAYLIMAFTIVGEAITPGITTLITAPYFFYFLLSEIFLNGQTIGKKVRNIRVTRVDGTEPRVGDFVVRWLFRLVEIDICGGLIALVTLLVRGKGQRLGDMAAGTTVVKIPQKVELAQTLYQEIEADYRPAFPEAAQLSDADISLAREVADALRNEKKTRHLSEAGEKMKASLERKMQVSSDLPPAEFLRTVLKDYNHLKR